MARVGSGLALILAGAASCALLGAASAARPGAGAGGAWLAVLVLAQCGYVSGLGTGWLVWSRLKARKGIAS